MRPIPIISCIKTINKSVPPIHKIFSFLLNCAWRRFLWDFLYNFSESRFLQKWNFMNIDHFDDVKCIFKDVVAWVWPLFIFWNPLWNILASPFFDKLILSIHISEISYESFWIFKFVDCWFSFVKSSFVFNHCLSHSLNNLLYSWVWFLHIILKLSSFLIRSLFIFLLRSHIILVMGFFFLSLLLRLLMLLVLLLFLLLSLFRFTFDLIFRVLI